MKVKEIVEVFPLLNDAKLTKMNGSDKIIAIEAIAEMTPIYNSFGEFQKISQEKLKGENHDELVEKAQLWQTENGDDKLTEEEKISVNKYFKEYADSLNKCLENEINKEVELTFTKMSKDAFLLMLETNDWKASDAIKVKKIICES